MLPVSVTTASSSRLGPIALRMSLSSVVGSVITTSRAVSTADLMLRVVSSTAPAFEAAESLSRFPSVPTISVFASSDFLSASARDAPIWPSPTIAIRSKSHTSCPDPCLRVYS